MPRLPADRPRDAPPMKDATVGPDRAVYLKWVSPVSEAALPSFA